MNRTITMLGATQVLLIILGFFGLGVVMKWNGYPDEAYAIEWNPLALWLRLHGLTLLLVPVFWTMGAGLAQSRSRFLFSSTVWGLLGVVLCASFAVVFLYADVNPYTRPFIMSR